MLTRRDSLAGMAAVAATLAGAPAVRGADLPKVTLAQPLQFIGGAPLYAALKLGYYRDEGLDVDIVTIAGTAPMFAGVASGSAQFGLTNGLSLLTAIEKAVPFVAFVGTDHGFNTLNMVVSNAWAQAHQMSAKDDWRTSMHKLAGARIGLLGTTSTGGLLLAAFAKQLGMPSDALTMIPMVPAAAIPALANGQIDAWFQASPPRDGVFVFDSGVFPKISQCAGNVIFTTADYLAKNGDIVGRMARAIARGDNAVLDPKTQPAVLDAVHERVSNFSLEAIKGELLKPGVPDRNGGLSAEAFTLANEFDAQIGLLAKPLSAAQVSGAYTLKYVPKTYLKP